MDGASIHRPGNEHGTQSFAGDTRVATGGDGGTSPDRAVPRPWRTFGAERVSKALKQNAFSLKDFRRASGFIAFPYHRCNKNRGECRAENPPCPRPGRCPQAMKEDPERSRFDHPWFWRPPSTPARLRQQLKLAALTPKHTAVAQSLGHCLEGPNPKIKGKRFRHVCHLLPCRQCKSQTRRLGSFPRFSQSTSGLTEPSPDGHRAARDAPKKCCVLPKVGDA